MRLTNLFLGVAVLTASGGRVIAQAPAASGAGETVTLTQALNLARMNEPNFAAAYAASKVAKLDQSIARSALLPSVMYHNQYLFTESNHLPLASTAAAGSEATANQTAPIFIANNGIHEYVSQAVVTETLGLTQINALARADAASAVASAELEINRRGLVATVVGLFYGASMAERKVAIARRALNEATDFLKQTQQREAEREVAHADVVKAQLTLQQRQREIADAELMAERSRLDMGVLLYADPRTRYSVALPTVSALPTRAEVEAAATASNAELASALARLRSANLDVTGARAAYLPELALNYAYGIDAAQLAVKGLDGSRNLGYSATATVDIPVWDWLATAHKVKQAQILRNSAKVVLSATQRRLIASLEEFYDEAKVAYEQLESLQLSVDTALDSLRLTRLRYTNGEASVLEVVDAQNALTTAELAEQDGTVRYQLALASLQTLTGCCEVTYTNAISTMRYGRVRFLPATLAFFLVCNGIGCKKESEKAPAPEVTVEAMHPVTGSITEEISADAVLAPVAQATILPKITAPVKKFYVQRGSHVSAGQLLATLENRDLEAAAFDNAGAYSAAKGAYTTATDTTVPDESTKARLDLAQAKATMDLDNQIVKSREQLLAQGAIPGRDLDTSKATAVQAQAAYDIALQHYEAVKKTGSAASMETAKGALESARGKYMGAEAQLGYTSIRAPIAGVVTERSLFAGETAAAGTPIVTVMDTSVMLAKLHVAQILAQQLQVGAEAEMTVPGMDERVSAKVSLVSPALDPGSTTVEVWLRTPNKDGKLNAGTPLHVTIKGRTVKDAMLVPTEAIQRSSEGAGKIVMVIAADGTAKRRPVTTGIQTAETTQILSGLKAADMVITGGGYGLDDGTKVKIGIVGKGAEDDTKSGDQGGAAKKEDGKE